MEKRIVTWLNNCERTYKQYSTAKKSKSKKKKLKLVSNAQLKEYIDQQKTADEKLWDLWSMVVSSLGGDSVNYKAYIKQR